MSTTPTPIPNKLYRRSVRGEIPYDHDLVDGDFDEILTYGMSPFIRWDSEAFTRWLYARIKAYLEDLTNTVAERMARKDRIGMLLAPDDPTQYNAMHHAFDVHNVVLIRNVYVPLSYFAAEPNPASLLLAVQKAGNLEMLRVVNTALINAQNTPP